MTLTFASTLGQLRSMRFIVSHGGFVLHVGIVVRCSAAIQGFVGAAAQIVHALHNPVSLHSFFPSRFNHAFIQFDTSCGFEFRSERSEAVESFVCQEVEGSIQGQQRWRSHSAQVR